ncbi:MAG: copper-binding protein [Gemmatimonadetes bacterium]|nr:copper-binding protein [Gemmatimonadota bacterium]
MRTHRGRGRRTIDAISARFVFAAATWLLAASRIAPAVPTAHTIDIVGDAYRPTDSAAQRGDTIRWRNTDLVAHTVTSRRPGFESGRIEPGGQFIWIAGDTGVFPYYCKRHRAMTATLTVR